MNIKSEEEMKHVLQTYGNLLYRTGYVILGNESDVQDVLQEVLIKYMEKAPAFNDREHEKAWLLRVTSNLCKDFLRFHKRHTYTNLEEIQNICKEPEDGEILKEVIALPVKWKTVLILHYLEGYQIKEISAITGASEAAVKKRLQRGREALKKRLQET